MWGSALCIHVLYRTCDPADLVVLQSLNSNVLPCMDMPWLVESRLYISQNINLSMLSQISYKKNALLDLQTLTSVLSSSQSPRITGTYP